MEKVTTENSVRDGGHYVPAMKYNGVIYISGQLSINPESGQIPSGGFKEEARQALKNLKLILDESGADLNDVIQCRVYLSDVDYWGDFNQVYASFFGDHKPARVIIPSNRLYGGCKVEVEAIAADRL